MYDEGVVAVNLTNRIVDRHFLVSVVSRQVVWVHVASRLAKKEG